MNYPDRRSNDRESGKQFIIDLQYLSSNEMADKYKVSTATVTKWRKEFDVRPKRSNLPIETRNIVEQAKQLKQSWDTSGVDTTLTSKFM